MYYTYIVLYNIIVIYIVILINLFINTQYERQLHVCTFIN